MVDIESTLLGIEIMLWIFLVVLIVIYRIVPNKATKYIAIADAIIALVDLAILIKLSY